MCKRWGGHVIKEKALYYYNSTPITQKDIEIALKKAGLEKGDIVMVHSDVGTFGKLGDIRDKEKFLDFILNAFLNVLGKNGTLIVPTFTYSFCKKKVFDVRNTPSTAGVFTEHVRKKNEAIRSLDPIFSCAGIGKDAKKLLENVSNECLGEDSVFDRLNKMNGKLMLFGRPFDITYVHYIENVFHVNYRFDKKFSGTIVGHDGNRYDAEVIYYVRHLPESGIDVNYDMTTLGDGLERRGLLKRVSLGNSQILCCKARDCREVGLDMLKKNEYAFLTKNPFLQKR